MISGASSPRGQSGPDVAAYPELLPPTLGEHVGQNVSLATSSDARLRRPVRVSGLQSGTSVSMGDPGPAPRKHAPASSVPRARSWGSGGFYCATRPILGRIFGAAVQFAPRPVSGTRGDRLDPESLE